jgi:hypothetical protein
MKARHRSVKARSWYEKESAAGDTRAKQRLEGTQSVSDMICLTASEGLQNVSDPSDASATDSTHSVQGLRPLKVFVRFQYRY